MMCTICHTKSTLFPDTVQGTSGVTQGIIAIDFKRGNGFSYKLIEYENTHYVGLVNGQLHIATSQAQSLGNVVNCNAVMFPNCDEKLSCTPFNLFRANVYANQGLAKLSYISPVLMDNTRATLKQYDKVRIMFRGVFNVKVIFDNGNVAIDENIESLTDVDKMVVLGIPNSNNNSFSIMFAIEGVGTVESIQYTWKPRDIQ